MKTRYQVALTTSLLMLTILCGAFLSSTIVKADNDTTADSVTITLDIACTITTGGGTYSESIDPGTYEEIVGGGINVSCNDSGGYALYAIGFSGESYDAPDNNRMLGSNSTYIPTATSGNDSYWAMKVAGSSSSSAVPTIDNSYSSYQIIPADYTKISHYSSVTVGTTNNSVTTPTYKVNISSAQPAGTYTGKVKYTMVHPNTAPAPTPPPKPSLYDNVASMSKGTQTVAQLRAEITVPTSADRTQDTSNSGVYEYNASVFGTASDDNSACTRADGCPIYYYRGVLENTPGSYGSDGSAVTYPNYVKLGNTCWRIVRTTGSGGVKMIYNGTYGATTSGSCANTNSNAQVANSAFSGTSDTIRQIVRVGYTYNSTYAENTSKSGTIAEIFGSNSNPGANNTRSDIKTYIEDTWYANNMTSYTSKLEASAGYCNDRTMNTSYSWTSPLAESSTIASTYGTSGQQNYYFGAYPRNANTAQSPSLTCGNKYSQIDRSTVDLYRYVSGSNGTSNQLKYPAALLTADEVAFAGSGYSASITPYHANSYLCSGSTFWLLSPNYRNSAGNARGFRLSWVGALGDVNVGTEYGVRPAISLTPGTVAASGTGTATNPWIVNP